MTNYELTGVSPAPDLSLNKNGARVLTFKSAPTGDLTLEVVARPRSIGKSTSVIRSTLGQEISASLTIDQIVLP